jgi:hypothetical protein
MPHTDDEVQNAYRTYITFGYAQTVVPKLMTLEQFATNEETVNHYLEAHQAAQYALNGGDTQEPA